MRSIWHQGEVRGGGHLIFATVGTHHQSFDRLVKALDELATKTDEEMIIQIGHSHYVPKHATWFRFEEDEEKFLDLYGKADVVVSHAGAGTLITVLLLQKPLVAVPRLHRYGEHMDDQQIELAEALDRTGDAIAVFDVKNIGEAIERARSRKISRKADNSALVTHLKEMLAKMNG